MNDDQTKVSDDLLTRSLFWSFGSFLEVRTFVMRNMGINLIIFASIPRQYDCEVLRYTTTYFLLTKNTFF